MPGQTNVNDTREHTHDNAQEREKLREELHAMKHTFEALGKSGVNDIGGKLETFAAPRTVTDVSMTSDEVTAVCPVTGQPDQYTVTIRYTPNALCIESKSLKLYFQQFRNEGIFCEAFAARIARDVMDTIKPVRVTVNVVQKARGGITISAEAYRDEYYSYAE